MKLTLNIVLWIGTFLLLFVSCKKVTPTHSLESNNNIKDSIGLLLKQVKVSQDISKKIQLLDQALLLSKEKHLDTLYLKSLSRLATINYKAQDYLSFKKNSVLLLQRSQQKRVTKYIGKGYYNLGCFFNKTRKRDSAFYYFNEAKETYLSIKDSVSVAKNLLNMAILQTTVGDYYGSENTSIKALSYIEKQSEEKTIRSLYNNLGIIAFELEHFSDALYWYKEALSLTENKKAKAIILSNIGTTYRNLNKYNQALDYYKKSLIEVPENALDVQAMVLDNMAYISFLKGETSALKELNKAAALRDSIKNYSGQIVSHLHLGEYYLKQNDTIRAFEYLKASLSQAKIMKDAKNTIKVLKLLSDNSSNRSYSVLHKDVKDSIYRNERHFKHQFASIRYRTQKQALEQKELQSDFNNQSNDLKNQKNKNILYTVLLTILCLLLIIVIYSYLQRKKIHNQQLIIKSLKARAEEKQKISINLHDNIAGDILIGLQKSKQLKENITQEQLDTVIPFFERAYEKARKISQDLSQVYFHKIAFDKKINNLCIEYSFNNEIDISHQGLDRLNWNQTNNEIKVAIYGILQESLNNVIKHSKASKVIISFLKQKKQVKISIQDNGVGFDLNHSKKGIGLMNMEKRISDINGTITFNSLPNNGTDIRVIIPLLNGK